MEEYERIFKRQNRSLIIGALLVFIAVTVFVMFRQTGDGATVEVQLDKDNGVFGIGGTGTLLLIPLDDITSVELVTAHEVGQPIEAEQHETVFAGKYHNDTLGTYTIYAEKDSAAYVVIQYGGEAAVFGSKNHASVEKAFHELTNAIG